MPFTPKLVLALICFLGALPAGAGPFADDLSKCLVKQTSSEERAVFVRWMFVAASSHPAVESLTTVTPEQLDASNKEMAALMITLLTDVCEEESQNALEYEGAAVFETAFQLFGTVAGQEMFSGPEVTEALTGFQKHLDASPAWKTMFGDDTDPE